MSEHATKHFDPLSFIKSDEKEPVAPRPVKELNQREAIFAPLHEHLVGQSTFIRNLDDTIRRLADSNLTVLITGETGTGKDVVARLIHRRSRRSDRSFLKVNCPALPRELLESELFGYEKGAFTGARTAKPGRFELADSGTIFLDEISEISEAAQATLIQVLDGEPFMRLGGLKPVHTNARIIAATNVALDDAVRTGRLRKDICFRLSEFVIHMIPLRKRPEDIPLLIEHFNFNYSKKDDKEYRPVPESLVSELQTHEWRGNVRALAARVKEFVATGDESTLFRDEANDEMKKAPPSPAATKPNNGRSEKEFVSLKEATRRAVESTERALIEEALRYTLWNRRKAAKLLSTSYSSLLRRIETYEIGKS